MSTSAGAMALPGDLARELRRLGAPAVLVARSREAATTRWSSGHRLSEDRTLDGASPLYAASVAKQFTAALAAHAVADGTLAEDTPLSLVLEGLPRWARAITVDHLVHHTAALPTTSALADLLGCQEHELDNDLVLEALSRVGHLPRPPGAAFAYSNTGYVVLAQMLQRATGTALGVLGQRWLFQPLGLTSARWGGPATIAAPEVPPPPSTLGDGGLWLSTEDLARWLDALNHDALGAGIGRLLRATGRLDDGTQIAYAWGATRRQDPRGALYTHGGNWPGWTTKTVRQPATATTVALMSLGADATAVSDAAMRIASHLAGAPSPALARLSQARRRPC